MLWWYCEVAGIVWEDGDEIKKIVTKSAWYQWGELIQDVIDNSPIEFIHIDVYARAKRLAAYAVKYGKNGN